MEAIDYELTTNEAVKLHAYSYFKHADRVEYLSKLKKAELISMLSGILGLSNSVVKNTYKMTQELAVASGAHHPDKTFQWNLPSITGALLGVQNATKVNQDAKMCDGCAYRKGTVANQSFATQVDTTYCRDTRLIFTCHDLKHYGKKNKPICVGHALTVDA